MKKGNRNTRFQKILFGLNILVIICTLPVTLVPFLNPSDYWLIAVLGIGFPFLLVLNLLFLILWAVLKKKWFFVSLVTLIVCTQQILTLIGFNFFKNNDLSEKDSSAIRVLSWNVSRWDESNKDSKGGVTYRPLMMDAIQAENADVLCLQEFFEPLTTKYFDKNISVLEKMGFTHYYFYPNSITGNGEFMAGMAIFSRLPILDTGRAEFGITPHSEGLIYADIEKDGKRIRIYSVHMESFRMGKDSYTGNIGSDDIVQKTRFYGWSVKKAYSFRNIQAGIVKNAIDQSPYPAIVCANLGDIPNSNAYFKVKGDMKDAFLSNGSGIGRTFRFFLPTLRVDYLFYNKQITVTKYASRKLIYSDHYPLIMDIDLNK